METIQVARDTALNFARFHCVGEEAAIALAEDWFDSGIGDDDPTEDGLVRYLTRKMLNVE